jgi:omega-amidase
MTSRLRIGLVQMEIVDGDATTNVAHATSLIRQAPPADLYLLPELWTSGFAHDQWARQAQDATPAARVALAALARERDAWIGGSLISRRDGDLVNRFWLVPPDQGAPMTYDKAHLFAPMGEPGRLMPGTERARAALGGWTAALSICYDLRFPEMYRLDALDGASLFLVVAEWPGARAETLRLLARARAVENQAYVAVCNRIGVAADGTAFAGGSAIVAPDGSVVTDAGTSEAVVVGTVDPEAVAVARRGLAVFDDRMAGVDTRLAPAETT